MAGSRIAAAIDMEYRMQQFYKKKNTKAKCKDKNCEECQFKSICTSYKE